MKASTQDKKPQNLVDEDKKELQDKPILMWKKNCDDKGNQQWSMIPEFYSYFDTFLSVLKTMTETINKKWKQQQVTAYLKFLQDVESYIRKYILTGQIMNLNLFYEALNEYGQNINPFGKELYDKQLDYLEIKQSGHEFILDKKKKKQQKYHPIMQKKRYYHQDSEKDDLIRQMKKQWTKYQQKQLEEDYFTDLVEKRPKREYQNNYHIKKPKYQKDRKKKYYQKRMIGII